MKFLVGTVAESMVPSFRLNHLSGLLGSLVRKSPISPEPQPRRSRNPANGTNVASLHVRLGLPTYLLEVLHDLRAFSSVTQLSPA